MATASSSPPPELIQQDVVNKTTTEEEVVTYKTKSIQFLGRNTLIILQNENGPCPLLAICNVLLLRNNLKLSPPDCYEDVEAVNAIVSKSYNALVGELVALETHNVESQGYQNPGDDSVDFAAVATAALGVPSPCLSKTRSFDDSPPAAAEQNAVMNVAVMNAVSPLS
ncbi:hypothetical protein Bca4012_018946 [Brassica carinata]|uniref:MINDY deubiquitinase domain-containing protein n=1 Tax=Brassica carinata TaxID=52824 RepID=A0A8X7WL99_BRACI|nr:hypothetical protein Bca52824_002667 [Brassica carinata]